METTKKTSYFRMEEDLVFEKDAVVSPEEYACMVRLVNDAQNDYEAETLFSAVHEVIWQRVLQRNQRELEQAVSNISTFTPKGEEKFFDLVGQATERMELQSIGFMRISVDYSSGFWEPAESGDGAIVMPCLEQLHIKGLSTDATPAYPVDLVAWLPRTGAVHLRIGEARALGEWHIRDPICSDVIMVHDNPGSWASKNGSGVYVLDWERCTEELAIYNRLIAENLTIAGHLDQSVRKINPNLEIMVPAELVGAKGVRFVKYERARALVQSNGPKPANNDVVGEKISS